MLNKGISSDGTSAVKASKSKWKIVLVFFIVFQLLFSVFWFNLAQAIVQPFQGFNTQSASMDPSYWITSGMSVSDGSIFMTTNTDEAGQAEFLLDVSSIGNSVDQGNLELDFAIDAFIDNGADGLDIASATIDFCATDDNSSYIETTGVLARGTDSPNQDKAIESDISIPVGTRYIFITLDATNGGTAGVDICSVSFNEMSIYIYDQQDPTISDDYTPVWTNQDVTITITAADDDSGIQGIYDADDDSQLSSSATYQYTVSENGTETFYTLDYANKLSSNHTVEVTHIDKNAPVAAPTINASTTQWTSSDVTFTLSEVAAAENESPEKRQYRLDGGEWQDYSAEVTVSSSGSILIEARVIDEAGNLSPISSQTIYVDKDAPVFDTFTYQTPVTGGGTVTAEISDPLSGVAIKKWAYGDQALAYFAASGTEFSGDSFPVIQGGIISVYAKDNVGNEIVDTIELNTYPTISPINDTSLDEDSTKDIVFTVSDPETAAESLLMEIISADTVILPHPTFVNSNGTVTMTLAPATHQFGGPINITVRVTDGGGLDNEETFTVTVNSLNDPPIALNDVTNVSEDSSVIINVLNNDNDQEGSALTVNSVSTAANGTVEIAVDDLSVTYTPDADFTGTDSFTYDISDGEDISNTATVNITVDPVNDLPTAVNDHASTTEDNSIIITVLDNDTDDDIASPQAEDLDVVSVTQGGFGLVEIIDDLGDPALEGNRIKYSPNSNQFGTDSFQYTIEDLDGAQSTATVTVVVESVDDAPQYSNLLASYTIDEDSNPTSDPINNIITFNISDVETANDSLMLQVKSSNPNIVKKDNIVIEGLGDSDSEVLLKITPEPDAYDETTGVTISLDLSDGFQISSRTFTLYVNNVNDAPIAEDDSITYFEDTTFDIDMDDLLLNDTDIDNNAGDLSFVNHGVPSEGSLTVKDAGENIYTFTPVPDSQNDVTFTYIMTDGEYQSVGTVTLIANTENDPPSITLDQGNQYYTDEDTLSGAINFTVTDAEKQAGDLSITAGSNCHQLVDPNNITINRDGSGNCSLTILPSLNMTGGCDITIAVSDGNKKTEESFYFTVNPIEDIPIAQDDFIETTEVGQIAFSPMDNDTDGDGDILTIVDYTQPQRGAITLDGDTFLYSPENGYSGFYSFDYTISDGDQEATATVDITVHTVADPPVISRITDQVIDEDSQTEEITFTAIDLDILDTVTVTAVSSDTDIVPNDSSNIIITNVSDNNYTIQVVPAANKYGLVYITITAEDSGGNTDTEVFSVNILPVNDIVVAVDDAVVTNEDNDVTFDVLANDSDLETAHEDLQVISRTEPTNGILSGTNGNYTYHPDLDFNGSDSFSYTVTDGEAEATATVNITIEAVNDNPTAYNNWVVLANSSGDESINIDVLYNDWDVDGDTVYSYQIVSGPAHGNAVIEEDGSITYTRTEVSPNANGKDSFVYQIIDRDPTALDGEELTANATVTIQDQYSNAVNAHNVESIQEEDCGAFTIDLSISNPKGNPLQISTSAPSLINITNIDNTNFLLDAETIANANGTESFTYTVVDTVTLEEDTATVYLTIEPINDAPYFTTTPGNQVIDEDTTAGLISTTGILTVEFADVETDLADLIFEVYVSNSTANTVILDEDITVNRTDGTATLEITPLADAYHTVDIATITLLVSDGITSTTETFTIKVDPVNDDPVAENAICELQEDTSKTFTIITGDNDIDGDDLAITLDDAAVNGELILNGDNTITYAPDADYNGSPAETIGYTLDDGNGGH